MPTTAAPYHEPLRQHCLRYTHAAMATDHEVTHLLQAWSDGDNEALDQLLPLVFDDLHRMAHYFFQRESDTHTLQPTALVSEVYVRLRGKQKMHWESRADFFSFAADVMRHFLVDYARLRKAGKRGGGMGEIPLASVELTAEPDLDLVDLHNVLEELEGIDPRQAQIVKLKYFTGLKVEEVAQVMEISKSTVKREWRMAKFWLRRRLGGSS